MEGSGTKHIPNLLLIYLIFASSSFVSSLCIQSDFNTQEITIHKIHQAFAENKLTSRQLIDIYLRQIETLNPELCTVIEVNPEAQNQADEADQQLKLANHDLQLLGPLHGIPVLLRDSIPANFREINDKESYPVPDSAASSDAGVVEKLRKAGAVILGKVGPEEWYPSRSLQGQKNWCTKNNPSVNPYVQISDPCGSISSSAISVAANMVAVALATEVDGSISCSADRNSVAGIKPTVGLTTRAGINALPTRLGTVGPVGRTVSDAVAALDAIVGYDPRDPEATNEAEKFIPKGSYKQFLNKDGLNGKRIAIIRTPYLESLPKNSITASMFEKHMDTLRLRGATIVENLATVYTDLILNPYKGEETIQAVSDFKLRLNKYLDDLNSPPARSENDSFPDTMKDDRDASLYLKAKEMGEEVVKVLDMVKNVSCNTLEQLMQNYDLDAVVTLGKDAFELLGITGYPGVTVPAGYETNGMPFGICFTGLRGSEPTLIQLAYGFEQATKIRRPPFFSKTFGKQDLLHISNMKSINGSFSAFSRVLKGSF